MGGMVAQELALRHAEPAADADARLHVQRRPARAAGPSETSELLGAAMLSGDRERALRVGFEVNVSARHAAEPGAYDVFRAMALELPVPVPVILLQVQAIAGHDTSDRLAEIARADAGHPRHGGPDAARRRRRADRAPDPRARASSALEAVGHMFWWEEPKRAARLVAEHALGAANGAL